MSDSIYDYIIVGAGSAGCVLAHRLTQDPATRVLLLEAGGADRKREFHMPAAFPFLLNTEYDWAFETEPQDALGGRRLFWPRGKVLGGTSAINGMIYIRGHPHDYDDWQAAGNPGWAFKDVLPYFKKAQHQERGPSDYHGVGGPLQVADLRTVNPLTTRFLRAAAEVGFSANADFNGARQDGFGLHQVNQKRGRRHSAAAAYLRPALRRANLAVCTHAQVTRILFQNKRATGVEYRYQGSLTQAAAAREVILCGGAVNSPQLLLLSGIGPAAALHALQLPIIMNLPGVGQNLQDHFQASVIHDCTQPLSLAGAESLANLLRFLVLGKGPFTSNVGEAGIFVKSAPELPRPDLEIIFVPNYSMRHGFDNPPGHGYTLAACVLRPASRGHITLHSTDPLAAPAIQPNYLTAPEDLSLLRTGLKLARTIAAAQAFEPVRGPEVRPGPAVTSDDELEAFIRHTVETLYHPVGTCKMGTDPQAVVDARLRVYGVTGLRVVDASIMPTLIGGNTNAPVIMIAEKAADMIREDADGGKASLPE